MSETKDRPIKDIITSIQLAISENKIKGQLARDLERVCVFAMKINNEDIETIKSLIRDWGFEYSLQTTQEQIVKLAKKLGMKWNDSYDSWEK